MRVYLVQHGEARSKDEDPERHLTERGVMDAERVSDFLLTLNLKAETIWHSGKVRARQTAEILCAGFSGQAKPLEREGLAPNDPAAPLKPTLLEASGDIVIVGHLPFLAKLAALLVTNNEGNDIVAFGRGCVLCLERNPNGSWKIIWMITPDLLVR